MHRESVELFGTEILIETSRDSGSPEFRFPAVISAAHTKKIEESASVLRSGLDCCAWRLQRAERSEEEQRGEGSQGCHASGCDSKEDHSGNHAGTPLLGGNQTALLLSYYAEHYPR